jgi:hypothetical protein
MRVKVPHLRIVSLVLVLCILICGAPILGGQDAASGVPAQASGAPATHPTLVFFSQNRLPDRAWATLFAAVRAELPAAAVEVPALDAQAQLIRGDTLAPLTEVPQAVNVYLHGDCDLAPDPQPFPAGQRLGWVVKFGPQIVPVIHVECTAVGQALSGRAEWMSGDARTAAMSEALTRVILHEWAHIAEQSSAHGKEGITKARFGVDDLMPKKQQAQLSSQGRQ